MVANNGGTHAFARRGDAPAGHAPGRIHCVMPLVYNRRCSASIVAAIVAASMCLLVITLYICEVGTSVAAGSWRIAPCQVYSHNSTTEHRPVLQSGVHTLPRRILTKTEGDDGS